MKILRIPVTIAAISLLLASCALIPPISVGKDALGYSSTPMAISFAATSTGFGLAATSGSTNKSVTFEDVEPPSLPITPTSFESVQGFAATATVTVGNVPSTLVYSGTLTVTLSDLGSDPPAPVVEEIAFENLTLVKSDEDCLAAPCAYTFSDAAAASAALRMQITGDDMDRLLQIISEGGGNQLLLELDATIESEPEFTGTMSFEIVVQDNFIRF